MKDNVIDFNLIVKDAHEEYKSKADCIMGSLNSYKVDAFKGVKCSSKMNVLNLLKYRTILHNLNYINNQRSEFIAQDVIDDLVCLCEDIIREENLDFSVYEFPVLKNSYIKGCDDEYLNVLGDYILGIKNNYKNKDSIKIPIIKAETNHELLLEKIRPFLILDGEL